MCEERRWGFCPMMYPLRTGDIDGNVWPKHETRENRVSPHNIRQEAAPDLAYSR